MSGSELKKLAKAARLRPTEIANEAGISTPTLYKVYNDKPVEDETKDAVTRAIMALRKKMGEAIAV